MYRFVESEMEEDMQFWSHVQPKNNWSQKFRNNAFSDILNRENFFHRFRRKFTYAERKPLMTSRLKNKNLIASNTCAFVLKNNVFGTCNCD